MAKSTRLASMSTEELVKLRAQIGEVLSRKANELRVQLSRLGEGDVRRGRGRSALKGQKIPPKYRDKSGNTWAGRGATPSWMTAAIKAGAKREDFLIDKSAKKAAKSIKGRRRAKK